MSFHDVDEGLSRWPDASVLPERLAGDWLA
jgi:hypothetical protein